MDEEEESHYIMPMAVVAVLLTDTVDKLFRTASIAAQDLFYMTVPDLKPSIPRILGIVNTGAGVLSALLGAIVADFYFGKRKVVLIGTVANSLAGTLLVTACVIPDARVGYAFFATYSVLDSALSLHRYALMALVAEQFHVTHHASSVYLYYILDYYFTSWAAFPGVAVAYYSIEFACLGRSDCLPVAFWGSALACLSRCLVLFALRGWFIVRDPRRGRFRDLFLCVWNGFESWRANNDGKEFWIDHADQAFPDRRFRRDVGQLVSVSRFLPFTLLFFYLRNRAEELMAGQVNKAGLILYEVSYFHVNAVISCLVILTLPVLETLSPCFRKMGILDTHMKRICTGCCFYCLMFLTAGFVDSYLSFPQLSVATNTSLSYPTDDYFGISLFDVLGPTKRSIPLIVFQLIFYSLGELFFWASFRTWIYLEAPPGFRALTLALFYSMSPLADLLILIKPTPSITDMDMVSYGALMTIVITGYVFIKITYVNQSIVG